MYNYAFLYLFWCECINALNDNNNDNNRELGKLWNMVTVIPIVVGALGTVPKGLERKLEELEIREKNRNHPQSTALLKST